MWRGPLFGDDASDRLRERVGGDLLASRQAAMELAIEVDLDAGRAGDAVTELTALVQEHPMWERIRAQLMLALYRCGRAAEALDVFRRARALFIAELGIEPGSELQSMHRRILARDPSLAPAPVQIVHYG
jgi:DNA-binding SARP family transcriptional activator